MNGAGGDDNLNGNGGNDRMNGGAGHDYLTGGAGADTFVLLSTAADSDYISDFVSGTDFLEISAAAFGGGLAVGALSASQFLSSASGAATTSSQRFLYNSANGNLTFDADGNGAGAGVLIASLQNLPALGAGDFKIV